MQSKGVLSGNVFGFDSKCIVKKWFNKEGIEKHIRLPIAVSINPVENQTFEKEYDRIMDSLFSKFKLERKRHVYSSSEIGAMFPPADSRYSAFCLAFTREIMNLPDVKFTFFTTSLNPSYLEDGMVTINGEYGSTTKKIGIEEFINLITDSYNVICAWKLSRIAGFYNQTMILDGTDTIRDCEAWKTIKENQNVKIIYGADKIIPVVSAADIILRNLEWFIHTEKSFINEDTIRKIIHYNDKISCDDKFYVYIGNPDLKFMRPKSERIYSPLDLTDNLQRPIFYLYAGGIPQQKSLLESFSGLDEIYEQASTMYGSVRIFDPKKDSKIIGNDPNTCDFFYPFNEIAISTLQTLKMQKRNVRKFGE
ncbi:MAG: hypothetical protein FWF07_00670 [Methanomassiliicoccaceae archaeon]|nr:hypothetical protein [Methanomassiliicoccaceae archaeon]